MSKKNKGLLVVGIVLMVIVFAPPFFITLYNELGPEFGFKVDPLKQEYTEKAYVEGSEIRFMLPQGYGKSEHDAFNAFFQNGDANFGVFADRAENLTDYSTRESYFDSQNERLMEGRESVYVREETKQYEVNNLIIHKKVYSAYKDISLNYYYCYLVEFQENPDIVAWVIITALPEYGEWYEDVFDYMVATAKLMPQTTMYLDEKFVIGDTGMQFKIANGFGIESHDSFDAYFDNGDASIGIYAYDKNEEALEVDTQELFYSMNEANIMDREGAKRIGEGLQYEKNRVNITKEVYSVDDDGKEVYFICYLVEFKEAPEKFAYVMVVGYKNYILANENYFDRMMETGRMVSEETVEGEQ